MKIRISLLLALSAVLAAPLAANANPIYTYQTIVELDPATSVDGIDAVIIDWITTENTGVVDQSELSYLSIALLAGAANLWHDISIVDGVVQPIGGAARVLADLFFDFDHNTNLLRQIRNATNANMAASSGLQYQVQDNVTIPADGQLVFDKYNDGTRSGFVFADVVSQDTRLIRVERIPEPATLGLFGLGLAGLAIARRRKAIA